MFELRLETLLRRVVEGTDLPLCATIAVFRKNADDQIEILVGLRGVNPEIHKWALPGGHLSTGETPEEAARRELEEETGVVTSNLELIKTRSNSSLKDYVFAVVMGPDITAHAGSDVLDVAWVPIQSIPKLAFDHRELVHEIAVRMFGEEI